MSKPRVRKPRKIAVVEGSDNVLTDLDIEMSAADMFKLHIAMAINRTIQKRKITQIEAARIIGLDQPKVSKILRGRLEGFSEGKLMEALFRLGRDIEVRFPERTRDKRGQLRVQA